MEINNISIKCQESVFKFEISLELKEKSENLIIKLSNPNQLYSIIYKESYTLLDLQKISNYFSNISLKEISSKINELITKEKYLLKRDYSNPSNLILILYPSSSELSSNEDISEISFKIPLEKNEQNLYEIIADMSFKINELNEKVKRLENDHISQEQMIDCDKKIEKLNIRLNRINQLNIYEDSNFLNRVQAVMSKDILLNKDDFDLLKSFINKGNIKISLIYKATIDSDFSYKFHEKCDNHSPTITLIKTDNGLRFGGYTTQTWNKDEECKQDDEAFLFSINLRKKYEIQKGVECAIYCGGEYGPTFGEGFDLCLCNNFMGVNGNYSNFPKSYGKGSSVNELTGNNRNFKINDVEVYLVDFC